MGQKGTCTSMGQDLETLFYFLIQHNFYFYFMTMVYKCLLTFLGIATKKRKFQTKAYKITPSALLNDSTSPSNEINGQDPSSFQGEVHLEEDSMSTNS